MVSMQHPSIEQLNRWRRGEVGEEEVVLIARHLATCTHCTSGSASRLGLDRPANAMLDDLANERTPRSVWPLLIAASIAVVIAVPLVVRKPAPPPVRPPIVRTAGSSDEWTELAKRVRNGESLAEPEALRGIRPSSDVLRGTAAATQTFDPSGVIVKSSRPPFRWPAPRGARSVVQIFRDDREVARSGTLALAEWRPDRDLARGVTYTWTVRVEHDGTTEILPAAPSPVARFLVVDAASLAAIEAAEARHPNDHLLAGIVHARAGLTAEAKEQLRLVTDPRDTVVARRLMHDIDTWLR